MSFANGWPIDDDGLILAADGEVVTVSTGLPFTADSVLAVSVGGTVVTYSNGLPYDADGKLVCVDVTSALPADAHYTNGILMTDDGICLSYDPAVTFSNGLPRTESGALAFNGGALRILWDAQTPWDNNTAWS